MRGRACGGWAGALRGCSEGPAAMSSRASCGDALRCHAVDLCDGTNVSIVIASTVTNVVDPHCPGLFTATRTWNATDSCSNRSSCSQTITIVDTTPPNLTCADNQIVECGNAWDFLAPSALDICDGTNVTITIVGTTTNISNPRCPGLITATRTWKATDSCTNTSLLQPDHHPGRHHAAQPDLRPLPDCRVQACVCLHAAHCGGCLRWHERGDPRSPDHGGHTGQSRVVQPFRDGAADLGAHDSCSNERLQPDDHNRRYHSAQYDLCE